MSLNQNSQTLAAPIEFIPYRLPAKIDMETTKAGVNDKAIAVAVKKSQNSQLALKWAIDNLMNDNDSLTLVHVKPKNQTYKGGRSNAEYGEMVAFCGTDLAKGLEQAYKETKLMHVQEMFLPLHVYCRKKNVHYEDVVLEDEDVTHALSDFVLANNIDVLVIGTRSRGGILRKLKGPDTAAKISKNMPYFCAVYTVAKGGRVSLKSPSSHSKTLSSPKSIHVKEPEIGIHARSFNSQIENRISVSAREALLQSDPVKHFEFRSPLRECGDSNFSWVGYSPSDTDISFISNTRPFYDHESSSLPTSGSNRSAGPLDSKHTSLSTSNMGYSPHSFRSSGASDSPRKTMDETRRLHLELTQMKKLYAADGSMPRGA